MKNINLNIIKTITNLLKRYNFVIFFIFLASGLILAVIMLTNIFTQPNNIIVEKSNETQALDQMTVDKLNRLENSSTNVNYKSLPAGRINPFSE